MKPPPMFTFCKIQLLHIHSKAYIRICRYIWSPHLQYQIHQIEKVQRSAARFVTNDFSYYSSITSMLANLKWPLLEQRRKFLKLIMFYKILHVLVNISITFTSHLTSTRGHSHCFVTSFARTDTYLNSFVPSILSIYGTLYPNH